MTPRTVAAGEAGLNFWTTETRIATITPSASSPAKPSPINLLMGGTLSWLAVKGALRA